MKIRYFTCLMLLIAACSVTAETIDELFEIAIVNDSTIQSLELSIDQSLMSLEQADLADALEVSVGTVTGVSMSYDLDDTDSLSVAIDPAVTITLPDPPGTEIDASTTLSLTDFALSGTSFGIGQSINTLSGDNRARKISELSDRSTMISLANSLREAKRGVKIQLLSDAKSVLSFRRSIKEAERAVEKQVARIDEEETLGTVNRGSARYLSMLNALKRAQRSLVSVKRDYERFLERFTQRTGITPDMFPEDLPKPEIAPPGSYGSEDNVSLFLLELSRDRATLSLEQVGEVNLSAGANYDVDETLITASVSAAFPTFSLSGSAGYDVNDNAVSASIGFGWTLNGRRYLELERMQAQANVKSVALDLEQAYLDSAYALEDLVLDVVEYEEAMIGYAEDLEYAQLYLRETQELFESGIADAETLEDAEWDLAIADYDGFDLAIDRIILSLRIEGFSEGIPE